MGKPGPRWTGEEIQKLKSLAQKHPAKVIAHELGRSVGALAVKAHELKLSLRLKGSGQNPSSSGRAQGSPELRDQSANE
jgi:hypothetical protein